MDYSFSFTALCYAALYDTPYGRFVNVFETVFEAEARLQIKHQNGTKPKAPSVPVQIIVIHGISCCID